jgi:glycosyltransferase involved in cell wall biosynthesis
MTRPTFSVVIPTLNEEKYLPQLLASLSVQTLKDFDVCVVDGSSKDKTVEKAKGYQGKIKNLKIIVSKKASLPLQRNIGARNSQGEWLVFVDADGVLLPYFFERVKLYIDTYHPQLLTAWFRPDTENNGDAMFTAFGNLVLEGSIRFKRPMSPGPLTIVTREAYEKVSGYDEEHKFNEDMDFGLRLHKAGISISIIKETLCVWSLRRMRHQGTLKVLQQFIQSALPILFLNTTFKYMPGYVMGGQVYEKKRKQLKRSVLKEYEVKLKKLMKELFG